MFRKSLALGIILLFVGTAAPPSINGDIIETNNVKNDSEYQYISSIINGSVLDLQYIYNITKALSYIIFTEYNESAGEIAKGRYFGTKGEHKAAEILYENMTKLGLYTWKERIQNIPEKPYIASKIEICERGLTVYDKISRSRTPVADCFVSPKGDFSALSVFLPYLLQDLKERRPILGPIAAKLITLLLPRPNGILDRKYNFYAGEHLTHNFSYTNLKVIRKPTTYSLTKDLIRRIRNNEPFVYIDKDMAFTQWPGQDINYRGFLYKAISKIPIIPTENVLFALFQPNCKGLILYDSNNDSYNAEGWDYTPIPNIRVNRTVGEKIYENPENYEIDFYINQRWNESVESYNVIGQLNGINPDETIIISCLYDSWWCQGTADSAIGMAMVLGIAKYFKDHNIMPKCNVKFIAFGGEEGGLRGAYYYEAVHRDENIISIIDLNQLGFTQTNPRLTLRIYTNNQSLNSTVREIADETNYVERTNNVTDFITIVRNDGGPPSNARVFAEADRSDKRSYNTILFVKCFGPWIGHHRDGLGHKEGDVLTYFNWTDVNVTGEMVWNVTKYFLVNPDCWFEDNTFTAIDSSDDEDDLADSVKASFTIKTSLPHDLVMVNASLTKAESGEVVANEIVDYTVTFTGIEDTIILTVPEHEEAGWYKCTLHLYNSTGRFNEILHLKGNGVNDINPNQSKVVYYYLYPYS